MPMSLAATSESVDEYSRAPSAMSRARNLLVLVSVPLWASASRTSPMADHVRLGRLPRGLRSARGIAHVADRDVADESVQTLVIEHLGHEPQVLGDVDRLAISHGNARAFLAPMLQCLQAEARHAGNVLARRVDAKDPAGLFHGVRTQDTSRCLDDIARRNARPDEGIPPCTHIVATGDFDDVNARRDASRLTLSAFCRSRARIE